MATIKFYYRSKKERAKLTLRLRFRDENKKDYQIDGKTDYIITKEKWRIFNKKRGLEPDEENIQFETRKALREIERFILDKFETNKVDPINREWLKNSLDKYYNPDENIPTDYVGFTDYYLKTKKNEISESKRKKLITTKNKMIRMQKEMGYTILLSEINESFKSDYINYSKKHKYSQNTQQRELVRIKALCKYAEYLGLETHHQLSGLNIKRQDVDHVYLNFTELETIKNHHFEKEYLNNARDWLIISCYTGQRVSDFMRFSNSMIREENGKKLLEFKQQKTQKLMTIPILNEVDEILSKRNGEFPRAISAQKYNDYIKEVCKACEINQLSKGKIRECIYPDKPKEDRTPYDYRDVVKELPKYNFVSSHIGRRSFATNYYGKVPTTFLKEITGHSTEKMFLNYIKKSNKDLVLDAFDYFNKK